MFFFVFFSLIHTWLYPHETHKHDKFEKNNHNAIMNFAKKEFLHLITPLPAEFIWPYQPIVCWIHQRSLAILIKWHQLVYCHKSKRNEFNFNGMIRCKKILQTNTQKFCLPIWYECISECMSKMLFVICFL